MKYQSVAVVDKHGSDSVVWHVDVSPNDSDLSRLSGAWVISGLDSGRLSSLVQSRKLVVTHAAAQLRLDGHAGVLDLDAVVDGIEGEIARLQSHFDTKMASEPKSTRVAPTWPHVPERVDLADPPRDSDAPDRVSVVLGIARWLESAALAWVAIERQRLDRDFLRQEEPDLRRFPGWAR
ncbi:hypothetical protein BVC93_21940 [Mycobacterium sp. MS1601]|uniref:hypothetical protein n=1 Tax=Mycobacterium sp. MS1601 TaxID=1936029 RepID=UPI0009797C21|nr:hypothetical protein [Mycobacterium sp. MS1601]AQA04641.1 hypothetical protein BVC93_21940 [Mycobacterium sp. MS1601]